MEIRLPRLAEGVESGTVVNVFVSEGQTVKKDESLLEIETEKAVAAVPSPQAGVVRRLHVKRDEKISVGQVIVTLDAQVFPPHRQPPSKPAPVRPSAPPTPRPHPSGLPPAASPDLRRMVRELGIDLSRVQGTGRGGRIEMGDLRAYVQYLQSLSKTGVTHPEQPPAAPAPEQIDFSRWGTVEEQPLSRLRQTIADRMLASWRTVARVTQFEEADITDLLSLKKRYDKKFEGAGVKLTLTALLAPVVVEALKAFPAFNSSLDEQKKALILKKYYHLGLAVDTPEGLIVPVLKEADKKSLLDISREIGALAARTRERKVGVEDLQGGTFTITNLGGIGGGHFTPVVYMPQVAILGVSRGRELVKLMNGRAVGRTILPLSLSYDHRVIDGANAVRFLKFLAEKLESYGEDRFGMPDKKAAPNKVEGARSKMRRGR